MRADFLYKYISVAPSRKEVDRLFKQVFPSFLGVTLSYHMPTDVCQFVSKTILEHKGKNPVQIKRELRKLCQNMMTNPKKKNKKKLTTYFEDRLRDLKEE